MLPFGNKFNYYASVRLYRLSLDLVHIYFINEYIILIYMYAYVWFLDFFSSNLGIHELFISVTIILLIYMYTYVFFIYLFSQV